MCCKLRCCHLASVLFSDLVYRSFCGFLFSVTVVTVKQLGHRDVKLEVAAQFSPTIFLLIKLMEGHSKPDRCYVSESAPAAGHCK